MKISRGFTFIEILLTVAIIGIVAGLVASPLMSGIQSYSLVAHRKAALSQARLVMDRFFYEARLISDTGSIDTWTSTALQFDISSESNVAYTLNGTNLERSGVVLADNVSSLVFTYYDMNGAVADSQSEITRIQMEIVVEAGTGMGAIRVRTQVFPRRFASAYAGFQ